VLLMLGVVSQVGLLVLDFVFVFFFFFIFSVFFVVDVLHFFFFFLFFRRAKGNRPYVKR